jgi:hypothetical protein
LALETGFDVAPNHLNNSPPSACPQQEAAMQGAEARLRAAMIAGDVGQLDQLIDVGSFSWARTGARLANGTIRNFNESRHTGSRARYV